MDLTIWIIIYVVSIFSSIGTGAAIAYRERYSCSRWSIIVLGVMSFLPVINSGVTVINLLDIIEHNFGESLKRFSEYLDKPIADSNSPTAIKRITKKTRSKPFPP